MPYCTAEAAGPRAMVVPRQDSVGVSAEVGARGYLVTTPGPTA